MLNNPLRVEDVVEALICTVFQFLLLPPRRMSGYQSDFTESGVGKRKSHDSPELCHPL